MTATFTSFVAPTGVRRIGPDVTLAPSDAPQLTWLPLVAQGGATFPLIAPATGVCRRYPITNTVTEFPTATVVLRLAPLPFQAAPVFRKLPAYPTFWFVIDTSQATPPDDDLLHAGDTIVDAKAAWIGVQLADRVTLAPAAWMEQLAVAMTDHDTAAEVSAWRALHGFDPTGRELRVLDHIGRPAAGQQLRVTGASGTSTITSDDAGVLQLPPGDVQLRWQATQPVHALYERSLADTTDRASSSPPGEPIAVPASVTSGHLQLLDAASWFASRPPQLHPGLGLVHPDSRMQPLVDGIEVFRVMLGDLRAATGPGEGAHFAGWSFNDFPFNPADQEHTMFTDLIRTLGGGSADPNSARCARFLMDKYLAFRPDAPTDAIGQLILLLLLLGVEALLIASVVKDLKVDNAGFLVGPGLLVAAFAFLNLGGAEFAVQKLEEKIDGSKDLAEAVNGITPNCALRSRHPARFVDNALQVINPFPIDPSDFIDGVGSYHQKFQVIRRAPDDHGNRVIGYVGGIDIHRNRLDTPGHHGRAWRPPDQVSDVPSPQVFHDVHSRVTGPAAADVALTFEQRWLFDVGRQPPRPVGSPPLLDAAFTAPGADDQDEVPVQPARHLVQIGRSGYTPNPSGGSVPLPWSPAGEATIPEAMINAIDQAREYIYIEDQYFTPPDSYIHALLEASVREPLLRLLIVIPTSSDQLFGDIRRREMFERLRADPATGRGWGDRMIVGALVRRPVLADPGRVASKGRLTLLETIGPVGGDMQITLAPRARLPSDVPFWLWIEGERMLAVEQRDDVTVAVARDDGTSEQVPARHYSVRRSSGAEPLWGARTRDHLAGAPVTLSQMTGIYVHTKAIMVDDIFVGVGSCNTNRRGMFHDGEIAAFSVPEQLKASRENPARNLRIALWAEHLGIPPAMGPSLLADPVAAFELFRRPTLIGNRVSGFDALGITPELGFPAEGGVVKKMLATLGITIADDLVPYIWNVFADPPTLSDPHPTVGPGLGTV